MTMQMHTSLRCTVLSMGWSGAKHVVAEFCRSGNVFSGAMTRASLFGSLIDEAGFGIHQESTGEFGGGGITACGCFSGFHRGPSVPINRLILQHTRPFAQ